MKYSIILLCSVLTILSCATSTKPSISYAKGDLKKISWIEGSWKGMDGQNPFYELYRFVNDTTIEIISYDWNGTDSSHSSRSLLLWDTDQYYLGDSLNYSVKEITDSSISMDPHYKANNSILWKTENANAWIAVLKAKNAEKSYRMERVNHFGN